MPDHSPGIGGAPTVTVPGVELLQVGLWAASTGLTNVTAEDLDACVAANRDPGVDAAPIKIGHTDPRFAADAGASLDGTPALGWATNMRVEQRPEVGPDDRPTGRQVPTLVADFAGVPAKLAAIMPHAYRRRSVEIGWGYRTAAGVKYRAMISAVALLGVTPPAVNSLADVVALYSAPAHTGAALYTSTLTLGVPAPAEPPAPVVALLAAAAAAEGVDPAAADSWARDLAQRMHAAAFAAGHDGANRRSTPGGPAVPVDEARIRQILGLQADADVEAAVAQVKAAADAAAAQPGAQPPAPAQPAAPAAAAPAPVPGLVPLNLPPGWPLPGQPAAAAQQPAPPAAQQQPAAPAQPAPAAAAPSAAAPAPTAAAPAPAAAAPAQPAPAAPAQPAAADAGGSSNPVGLPPGFTLPPGMSIVSDGVLAELRNGAQAGSAAAQALEDAAIEQELVAAFKAGKITMAPIPGGTTTEVEHWRGLLKNPASRTGARALLAAAAPRFPVTALGAAADLPGAIDDAQFEAFEASIFGWETPAAAQPQGA